MLLDNWSEIAEEIFNSTNCSESAEEIYNSTITSSLPYVTARRCAAKDDICKHGNTCTLL